MNRGPSFLSSGSLEVKPVFLVGAHRSGTTLLRLMLNHHPEISVPGEFDFLTEIMIGRTTRPTESEYLRYLSLHRNFVTESFECSPGASYESLVKGFVQQLSERYPSPVFVVVVHSGFQELARIWPEARFVHIVRDPRDVAASAVKLHWAGNVFTGVQRWMAAESAWNDLSQLVPPTNRCEIRFEDLIENLETTLQRVCAFLDVPYSDEMLSYHLNTTYGPPDPALTYRWKRTLSPTEIGTVEGVLGGLLQAKGYDPSGYDLYYPSLWMRRKLLFEDRYARLNFRIKRFGLTNTLGVALARRLKLRSVERKFQLRINEISRRHLK